MKLEDVIEFIRECDPKFSKGMDDKYCMFTVPTQHIRADTIEELLEEGISLYKKLGNNSYFSKAIADFENQSMPPNNLDICLDKALMNYFKNNIK